MEPQDSQNPVQFAPESLDKLPSSLSITPPKKNISSGEDAFVWQPLFKELEYDCAVY
jgi:hypothetical protein